MEPEIKGTNIGQLIAIAPEEIPAHLKQGKEHLAAGRLDLRPIVGRGAHRMPRGNRAW